jgi:hypothetical protein
LVLLILRSAIRYRKIDDIDGAREIIGRGIELYPKLSKEAVSHENEALGRLYVDQREICSTTWLALAPSFLDRQTSFDVWMMMREGASDLFVTPDRPDEQDLVKAAARLTIIRLYQDWRNQMPAGWDNRMAGRAAYAEELAQQAEERLLQTRS